MCKSGLPKTIVFSFWGVKLQNGRQGAGMPQRKISNVLNIARLTSYFGIESELTKLRPDLTLTQVIWYIFKLYSTLIHAWRIKKLVDPSFPFIVPLTTGLELDSFISTMPTQHCRGGKSAVNFV